MKLSSLSKRWASMAIDTTLISFAFYALKFFEIQNFGDPAINFSYVFVGQTIFALVYFATMESSEYQASLGKLLTNCKVQKASGEKVTFDNAFARYLIFTLSLPLFVLNVPMALMSEKKQFLHDRLTSTVVVD